MSLHRVNYVTSSESKRQENEIFQTGAKMSDGTLVSELFRFDIRRLLVAELLLVDIEEMVAAEVISAYRQIKVPCVVEHAGLIFEGLDTTTFPGGLTKPMWNALKPNFVRDTGSANRRAIARAVVAYCDGQRVRTFVGETHGRLAATPRGTRDFYWDNVFEPDDPSGRTTGMTYAEIVEDSAFGLPYKVLELSQSSKAMLKLLEFLREEGTPPLWR